jgi:WD40 repeat protein
MTKSAVQMRHPGGGFLTVLEFSPVDPDVLASTGADGTVRLWSLRTGEELVALQGPSDPVMAMTFGESGRRIYTLEQSGRIAVWDATTRRNRGELIASGPPTMPLGFSADSATLATIDEKGELRYWDLARRREIEAKRQKIDINSLYTSDFEIIAPVMSQDLGTLALGTVDGRVQLWRLPMPVPQTWSAHAKSIRNVAISPDGKTLASVGDDSLLKLWTIASRALLAEITIPGKLSGKNDNVPLVWSRDGRTLILSNAKEIMLHDGANGRLLHKVDSKGLVYSLRSSTDDRLLVSGQKNRQLGFWDPRSGTLLEMLSTSLKGGAYDVCFSPDGRTLVAVGDQVKLWSVGTRLEVASFQEHEYSIFAALFSPDGNSFVTADYGGTVRLWSALPFETTDARVR